MFYYQNLILEESEYVYPPSEDSLLLASCVHVRKGERVLDMGCGCGLIGILAAKQDASVVCADINPHALELTKRNAKRNGVVLEIVQSDLFSNLGDSCFDKIFFNPPYVPCEEPVTHLVELAWNGGKNGNVLIERFLCEFPKHVVKGGKTYIVLSSMNQPNTFFRKFPGLFFKEIAREHVFFEDIYVYEVSVRE